MRPMRPLTFVLIALVAAACGAGAGSGPLASDAASGPTGSDGAASGGSAAPTEVPVLGAIRTDAAGISQVWVPAGTFRMGTDAADTDALAAAGAPAWVTAEFPSESPAHEVTVSSGFWIDRDEVTNAAFEAFTAAGGYTTQAYWSDDGWAWVQDRDASGLPKRCPADAPDVPRRCITWYEAEAYAAWRGGALPTEAQWEYAARGPESRVYPWGDAWDPAKANVVDSTAVVVVGSFPDGASWVGARDMAGNAMEWVADWLDPAYYATSPATDPTGPATGEVKVEKGGWWGSNEFVARSAYRHYEDPPTYQDKHIGFRVVSP